MTHPTWRPSRKAVEAAWRIWMVREIPNSMMSKTDCKALRRALLAAWKIDHATERR